MRILGRTKTLFLLIMAFLLLCGTVHASSFTLTGDVLKVGVSSSGALVNDARTQGITYIPSAFANDFTQPGRPWEFYSIGVIGAGGSGFLSAGYNSLANVDNNTFGLTTTDWSSGGNKLAVSSDGIINIAGNPIAYTQNVYFEKASNVIHFGVDIQNLSSTPISVVYARGLDPDQDATAFGQFKTINWFPGAGQVSALGTNTNLKISIIDHTGFGVAAISDSAPDFPWTVNPYTILAGGLVNGAVAGYADYSINMAWALELGAFKSYQLDFEYQIVPLPPTALLLGSGLLGLVGLRWRRRKES